MRLAGRAGFALLTLSLFTPTLEASSSNPPDLYPGVQGMVSCLACHSDAGGYGGPGSVSLEGLPARFEPGEVYTMTMRVKQPGASRFGFQLYAVDQEGQQAGRIAGDPAQLDVRRRRGVTFLKQSFHGSHGQDEKSYQFQWRAPEDPSVRVGFVAEAVGADGHGSSMGDHVYRLEAVVTSDGQGAGQAALPRGARSD